MTSYKAMDGSVSWPLTNSPSVDGLRGRGLGDAAAGRAPGIGGLSRARAGRPGPSGPGSPHLGGHSAVADDGEDGAVPAWASRSGDVCTATPEAQRAAGRILVDMACLSRHARASDRAVVLPPPSVDSAARPRPTGDHRWHVPRTRGMKPRAARRARVVPDVRRTGHVPHPRCAGPRRPRPEAPAHALRGRSLAGGSMRAGARSGGLVLPLTVGVPCLRALPGRGHPCWGGGGRRAGCVCWGRGAWAGPRDLPLTVGVPCLRALPGRGHPCRGGGSLSRVPVLGAGPRDPMVPHAWAHPCTAGTPGDSSCCCPSWEIPTCPTTRSRSSPQRGAAPPPARPLGTLPKRCFSRTPPTGNPPTGDDSPTVLSAATGSTADDGQPLPPPSRLSGHSPSPRRPRGG